jgi:chemotaxis signal transduction protein
VDAGTGSLTRASARSDALSDLTLLIFDVEGHRYALHASEVEEILRAALPSRLAHAPDVIEGVLNVRGRIAAVLDIRARFGLARRAMRASDVLIVCDAGERLLALHADTIVDIVHVPASALAAARVAAGKSPVRTRCGRARRGSVADRGHARLPGCLRGDVAGPRPFRALCQGGQPMKRQPERPLPLVDALMREHAGLTVGHLRDDERLSVLAAAMRRAGFSDDATYAMFLRTYPSSLLDLASQLSVGETRS